MNTNKKILLILPLPPPFGGGEIRSEYLYKHLRDNADYSIITISRKKSNKLTQGKFTITNALFGLKIFSKIAYQIIFFRPKKVFIGIPKQFGPFVKVAMIIGISSVFRVKVIGELAGDSFLFLNKENYQKKIGLYFLRKMNEIRVLGESVKKKLEPIKICKLTVLDNGIYVPSTILISREHSAKPLKLLFVGALNYSKGVKNLIETMKLLKEENLDISLNLVGEWSDKKQKEEILKYINSHELSHLINFHGILKGKDKWTIYENSSLLVHPTFWDGQPLVILEAMGCGLPIISTKIGAIPDTMTNNVNGILLEENTTVELSIAIKVFYDNSPLINQISINNLKTYTERFTVESYVERMIKWFEE